MIPSNSIPAFLHYGFGAQKAAKNPSGGELCCHQGLCAMSNALSTTVIWRLNTLLSGAEGWEGGNNALTCSLI